MSKFKFPKSIHSRPVYGTLEPRAGKAHLLIAEAEGADAILDLAKTNGGLMAHSHIIYIANNAHEAEIEKLQALGPEKFYAGPSYAASVTRIQRTLSDAHMGLQIYLTGTESMMGQAMFAATSAGIPHTAIQTEHRGSVARRMQCVHCKGITENVITDPFVCAHCGLNLYVRDHYSRRHAAFQGVCIDAEDPGNVPEQVELYK